jgi:zinc protease
MRRFASALGCAFALLGTALAGSLRAQDPGSLKLETYTLPNGLTVILGEDHSAQVVAVDVWYNVGSRNERPGRTGFAHLFEHMMFQGSEHVKKGEHFKFIERAGGQMNGSTQPDRTNYWEALPSNRLNLGLWLEADRMRSLAVNDSNLHNQREAVKEERRLRVDNPPYVKAVVEETTKLFDGTACFAYAHSIIGSMDDLNAAKLEDVQGFFKLYYAPNNATLVIVGDFVPAEAKRLVSSYFGGIPRVEAPPPVTCDQPFNTGAMRQTVNDKNANLPALLTVYRVPATSSADYPALELLTTILGQGESSRLNKTVVRSTKAATVAQALFNPFGPRRGPGLAGVLAIANQGVPIDSIDKLVSAEVLKVASGDITDAELTKAKNAYRAGAITQRQQALAMAEAIQEANMYFGSPEAVNTAIARYGAVTLDDVKRVAATYLRPDNALTLLIVPAPAGGAK